MVGLGNLFVRVLKLDAHKPSPYQDVQQTKIGKEPKSPDVSSILLLHSCILQPACILLTQLGGKRVDAPRPLDAWIPAELPDPHHLVFLPPPVRIPQPADLLLYFFHRHVLHTDGFGTAVAWRQDRTSMHGYKHRMKCTCLVMQMGCEKTMRAGSDRSVCLDVDLDPRTTSAFIYF